MGDYQSQSEYGIKKRINDTADMYGHPCLLLAEHIATEAQDIARMSMIFDTRSTFCSVDDMRTPIFSRDFHETTMAALHTTTLTDNCFDPDGRITELQLAVPIRESFVEKKRLWRREMVQEGFERDVDRPMYLLAVARKIGVPIMRISSQVGGTCSFVNGAEMLEPFSEEDMNDPERREQLINVYELLKYFASNNALKSRSSYDTTFAADLVNMGAVDAVAESLGEAVEEIEYVISELMNIMLNGGSYRIPTSVTQNSVSFPAHIDLLVRSIDGGAQATATLTAPGSNKLTDISCIPPLRIYPGSNRPLQFESVPGQVSEDRLINEFVELLLMRE